MSLESYATLACVAGESIVLASILYSRAWRNSPVFTGYITCCLLSDVLTLWTQLSSPQPDLYLLFYRNMMLVDLLLRIALLIEIAIAVLNPVIRDQTRSVVLILIGIAAVLLMLIGSIPVQLDEFSGDSVTIFRLSMASTGLTVLWLAGLGLISNTLGICWRQHALQIAVGLFTHALLNLVVVVLSLHTASPRNVHWFSYLTTLVYLAVLVYWARCFAKRDTNEARSS